MIPAEIRAQMIGDIKTRRTQADRDAVRLMGSPNQLSPTWRDVDVLIEALDDDAFQLYRALENLYGDVYLMGLREITAEDIYAGSMHDAIKVLKRLQQYRSESVELAIGQKTQVTSEQKG